jgi:hypothetical protein
LAKVKVAMYGLTTEGYNLAASIADRAEVTLLDETLQMAMDGTPAFFKHNPNLEEMMAGEPLLSFKPIGQVLESAQVVFFTPKLRRPFDEALIEAGSKLREMSKYIMKGATVVNTLPTGPGGNSENIMMMEKQTGLHLGDSVTYAYMPLAPGSSKPSVVSAAGGGEKSPLGSLGFATTSQNVFAAELEYAEGVLQSAMEHVAKIEFAKKAREAGVALQSDGDVFIDDFARRVYELKAIQTSDQTGESISYLAGAALKSLENFVRYMVEEAREVLKQKELKASRTKINLMWGLDSYEMRADRIQMAQSIQLRLKDYVTDVEIVGRGGGREVVDQLKHNVMIVCSREDYERVKAMKKGHGSVETTVIRATPSLRRD